VRRFAATIGAVVATLVLPLATAAARDANGLRVTEAAGAKFPVRTFVLSLPSARELTADRVHVSENGQDVLDVSVIPASRAGKQTFGTVLVVDASDSMHGVPIARAVAAERAFAARRNINQQLGVVAFNSKPKVTLPLTTKQAKIDSALASVPKVAYGTHIYDAIATAQAMLAHAHIDAGSIVLLSDGADTGSKHTAARVAAAARTAHVRLFTIGLRSGSFQPHTLESLAKVGDGEYALARTTRDLAPLFDELAQQLSREYLVGYKSLAQPEVRTRVSMVVDGIGRASAEYETPALPVHTVAPYSPSVTSRVLGSPITMLALVLFAAAVVAFLVFGLLRPRYSGLPQRMAEFVSVPGLQSRERRPSTPEETVEGDEVAPRGLFARLDDTLDIAQINTTGGRLVLFTIAGTVGAFALLLVGTGSGWWALLAFMIPLGVRSWVSWRLKRRRKAFAEQLPDMLQVISAALRAGQSFAASLSVVVESSAEPMKSEMQTVVFDEQLGIPLDRAMAVVVRRMHSRDLEQIALVAELQREAGGNASEVIDRVAETVRERHELRRLISTLTVQGRMSRWIVTALPIALVTLISIINPHYEHPLVMHLLGKVMIVFAVLLVIGGSLVIKKIVDIKV
jgi:Flp pilus assembly protein TadB/Mg-chelatase subunit ChlD